MALKEPPDRYLGMIIHFFMNFHNDTSEFKRPHLRKSFEASYMVFVFLYGTLTIVGFVANAVMLLELIVQRQQCFTVHKYLACNAVNDILKCAVVLPISLSTTLLQNWIYGSFLCYFFPMLQDVPFHGTLLTFFLIFFDRYREIVYPMKPTFPSCACMVTVWLASIFAVMPYAIYTRYLDLELYLGIQFKNTGICVVNIEDNIEEYIRGLFIVMYVLPLGLIAFMHVKTTEEIKSRQSAYSVYFHDARGSACRETDSLAALTPCVVRLAERREGTQRTSTVTLPLPSSSQTSHYGQVERCPPQVSIRLSAEDDGRDWAREKKIQTYAITVLLVYAACLLPLNLLRLLKHVVNETNENSHHFDVTFITFVWIAFLPTVVTPVLFKCSRLCGSRTVDESSYLRFGRPSELLGPVADSPKPQPSLQNSSPMENRA